MKFLDRSHSAFRRIEHLLSLMLSLIDLFCHQNLFFGNKLFECHDHLDKSQSYLCLHGELSKHDGILSYTLKDIFYLSNHVIFRFFGPVWKEGWNFHFGILLMMWRKPYLNFPIFIDHNIFRPNCKGSKQSIQSFKAN